MLVPIICLDKLAVIRELYNKVYDQYIMFLMINLTST